jgi:hypothetical protein
VLALRRWLAELSAEPAQQRHGCCRRGHDTATLPGYSNRRNPDGLMGHSSATPPSMAPRVASSSQLTNSMPSAAHNSTWPSPDQKIETVAQTIKLSDELRSGKTTARR